SQFDTLLKESIGNVHTFRKNYKPFYKGKFIDKVFHPGPYKGGHMTALLAISKMALDERNMLEKKNDKIEIDEGLIFFVNEEEYLKLIEETRPIVKSFRREMRNAYEGNRKLLDDDFPFIDFENEEVFTRMIDKSSRLLKSSKFDEIHKKYREKFKENLNLYSMDKQLTKASAWYFAGKIEKSNTFAYLMNDLLDIIKNHAGVVHLEPQYICMRKEFLGRVRLSLN